jgi:hypothetical protein
VIDTAGQIILAGATFALSLRLTGDHTAETPFHRRIAGIGYGVFGLALVIRLLSGMVPVVGGMAAPVVEHGPGYVVMSVTADKRRKGCQFEYSSAYLLGADGVSRKAGVEVLDDPIPGESRPAGKQWFGDWRLKFDPGTAPVSVRFFSHHDCGLLHGRITTESGPFTVAAQAVKGG